VTYASVREMFPGGSFALAVPSSMARFPSEALRTSRRAPHLKGGTHHPHLGSPLR
jgi:hypothetical protein